MLILINAERDVSVFLVRLQQRPSSLHDEAVEECVDMVLDLERQIADWFIRHGQDWKWLELKENVAELVRKRPVKGLDVVQRWGLKVQVV